MQAGILFSPCPLAQGPQTLGLCLQAKMVEYTRGPRCRKSFVALYRENGTQGSSRPLFSCLVIRGSYCVSTALCSQSTFPGAPHLIPNSSSRQVVRPLAKLDP